MFGTASRYQSAQVAEKTCWCGCGNPRTHAGKANGVALTTACELGIARWVKTGSVKP
jgi:hypothetical protein